MLPLVGVLTIGLVALGSYIWQQYQVWRNYWREIVVRLNARDVTRNPSAQTLEATYNKRTYRLVCDNSNSLVQVALNHGGKIVRLSYLKPDHQKMLGAGQSDSERKSIPVFDQLYLFTSPASLADAIVADELLWRDFGDKVRPHLSLFEFRPSLFTEDGWLQCRLYPPGPSWGRNIEKFHAIVNVLVRLAERIEETAERGTWNVERGKRQ